MQLSPHNRLLPHDVERLHRVIAGDPATEEQILRFIAARYKARSLLYLPPKVATAILKRPAHFILAAQRHEQPELPL